MYLMKRYNKETMKFQLEIIKLDKVLMKICRSTYLISLIVIIIIIIMGAETLSGPWPPEGLSLIHI